jgi:hypothetical protein
MVLAALTAAMVVAGAVMYNASFLSGRLAAAGAEAAKQLSQRVTVVYAFVNTSSGCHIVVLKNTGEAPIGGVESSTLVLGNSSYTVLLYYSQDPSPGCGCWGYREVEKPDGTWEPMETLVVEACPAVDIEPPYRLVMVLPSGLKVSASYTG